MSVDGVTRGAANQRLATVIAAVLWIAVALVLARIATAPADYQWDFRVFHKAPAVHAAGGNPYDDTHLSLTQLAYLYPPLILQAFTPLSWLPFETAYALWFGLKILALVGLVWLWHRHFEPLNTTPLMIGFIAFAFNGAILRDFTAGNIAVFEQLGLWCGFLLIMRGRSHAAAMLIAGVAQFKLMPVVFLGLLPVVGPARGWRPLATGVLAFSALLGANFFLIPELSAEYAAGFFGGHANIDERGAINPSSLALMRDVAYIAARLGIDVPRMGDWLFLTYVTGAVATVGGLAWKYRATFGFVDPRLLIYSGCLLYVLTMPRVKDYTYMILLIPALFAVRRLDASLAVPLIGVLVVLPAQTSYVPGIGSVVAWLEGYLPLFTAVAMAALVFPLVLTKASAVKRSAADGLSRASVTGAEVVGV